MHSKEELPMQSHPTLSRAVLGGFGGTAVMTAMMYLVAPMMGLHMDIAAMLGSMLGGSWVASMIMHVVNGALILPAVYVYAVYDRVPGSPAIKGVIWGVTLWLIAQTMVMPMMGAGSFSSNAGGMMAAMGSLVGHVMYGSVLGVIVSAPEPRLAYASC
jgi:uncharacterized protein DUF6789